MSLQIYANASLGVFPWHSVHINSADGNDTFIHLSFVLILVVGVYFGSLKHKEWFTVQWVDTFGKLDIL